MRRAKMMLFSHICGSHFITGAEKYLLMLASELSQHFDCTLVVPSEGVLLKEANHRGIQTVVHDIPLVWSMFRPGELLTQQLEQKIRNNEHGAMINLLHMHQPDLVVVNTIVNPIPAAAAKALGIPVAWFITEKVTEQAHTLQSVGWIDRFSDWIIGISEATLQPFRSAGLNAKLHLLPPTWLMEELQPDQWPYYREKKRIELGILPEQRVVSYISSSLHPEKGLEHFVQMALQICPYAPDVRFLIVGNMTDQEYVERCAGMIQESSYANRFHRIVFEPRIEMLYPAMDFVVIPSLIDEGFGMTALEGLVFGKNVIAYRAGGLEEILRATGSTSGLVEKGDIFALAAKMKEQLLAGAISVEQSQLNQQQAEAAFGYKAYLVRLRGLIDEFQKKYHEAEAGRHANPLPPMQMNAVYKSKAASAVFLLENGVKRPFVSAEAFHYFKYRWGDIHWVSDLILHRFPTSIFVSNEAPFHQHRPSVMLAKGSGPTVYLLMNQQRFPFTSANSMKQRGFDPRRIVKVSDVELRALAKGGSLKELNGKIGKRRQLKQLKPKQKGTKSLNKRGRLSAASRKRKPLRSPRKLWRMNLGKGTKPGGAGKRRRGITAVKKKRSAA